MKQVTRNIDPESARDLLQRVPRACIAFAHDQEPQSQPAAVIWRDNRYFIGIPAGAPYLPVASQEVVVLVDEGIYYFDLRAVYVRGHIQPAQPPTDGPAGHTWFELFPDKTVAWDYGTLREVDDGI